MMRSRLFAVLVAAMVVGVCGVAPAASAETVTLRDSNGDALNPGDELSSHEGSLTFTTSGGTITCSLLVTKSEVLESSADPATFQMLNGWAKKNYSESCQVGWNPYLAWEAAKITSGVASFSSDGTGSIPIDMTIVQTGGYKCEMSGNVAFTWSKENANLNLLYSGLFKKGGTCIFTQMAVQGWTGEMRGPNGLPIEITTP